ncbi:hypothetical protein [uncultured Jatrophihabitans sp.]|uniref:hypothetical protein n=1 Tax=uncultured Jatrophihabitans sp. TaxID=1610747 RepID=UPI0035C9AEC6
MQSDLHVEVEGLHASLVADGRHLTLVTDDAGALLGQARSAARQAGVTSSPRLFLAEMQRRLDDAGLTARVVGRRGVLVETGRGATAWSSRITGSPDVQLGRAGAVVPAVWAYVLAGAGLRGIAATTTGLVAAGVLVGVVRHRRPRRGGSS